MADVGGGAAWDGGGGKQRQAGQTRGPMHCLKDWTFSWVPDLGLRPRADMCEDWVCQRWRAGEWEGVPGSWCQNQNSGG